MRTAMILLVVVTLLAAPSSTVQAQQAERGKAKQQSVEEAMASIVKLGPGVHAIKKNKKGRIISCVVVGQARISTVLGKTKGLELALRKASLMVSAEFAKWLKEDISVYENTEDETVVLLEGSEGGDTESFIESGKALEASSTSMKSVASGLVRGLQILHKDIDPKTQTYSIVKGWKADTAEGTKSIAAAMNSDEPTGKRSPKKAEGNAKSKKKSEKNINRESATSKDAGDFLP